MSTAKLPTVKQSRERRRVRPGTGQRSFSPAEIADLCGVDEARILAALERAQSDFFPHATFSAAEGWTVPAVDVRRLLGGTLEPLLTVRQFAELCGLSYFTVHRAVKAGHVRAVGPAWLASQRIPASEYWRFRGEEGPRVP